MGGQETQQPPPPVRPPPLVVRTSSCSPKSFLSQSQHSLPASSGGSSAEEDSAWYSHLFLSHTSDSCATPATSARNHHQHLQLHPHHHQHSTRKIRRSSTFNSDDLTIHTPSPSDSEIVDLESLVREKEAEISFLRETLEQNEQVSARLA